MKNKIVLGTVQFGINYGINNSSGQVPLKEVCTILKNAKRAGIETLDTSSAYGSSEQVLGKALKESKTHFRIVSKYPMCDQSVRDTFNQSLENLGVGELYGYLVHHFDYYQEYPKIFDEMITLKNEGKIHKVGFSLYSVDELKFLFDNNVKFDIIQFPYNIFDRQFEPYMQKLVDLGVEIHTRSAFLQGLFFKDTNTLPEKLLPLKKYLDSLHRYCNKVDISIEQIAFGYVLANENVRGALIGVDNHLQLDSNLKVASHQLSLNDIDFIKSINIQEKELLNPSNWNQYMKILAITQARYGSTRLPAKILKEVNGVTLLETHLRRILQSKLIDKLMVATTNEEGAHYIVDIAKKVGVGYYQGSVDDVLDRFYQTALPEKPDYVVRVTSDCPLIDPAIIDATIQKALDTDADYCTNVYPPMFPDGMDCEVMKFSALEIAWKEATLKSDREHVTEFIGKNSPAEGGDRFTYANYDGKEDNSDLRITVDTPEDFEVVKILLEKVGDNATCEKYVKCLREHKEITEINNMYERNEGYLKSLKND